MNRTITLLTTLVFMVSAATAQLHKSKPGYLNNPVKKTNVMATGDEIPSFDRGTYLKQSASNPSYGDTVGYTWYDYQSNGSMQQRIYRDMASGDIQVVWTKALDTLRDPSNAFRGIGYNFYDASAGVWLPGDSLNTPYGLAEKRVGWPSIAPVDGNTEYIFAHTDRLYSNAAKGSTNITPTNLGGTLHPGSGVTFYHSTAEGNSIYTTYSNGNTMNFGRSDDGGATWAISEMSPDSLTGCPLKPTTEDAVDMDVKGDTIAMVMGGNAVFTGTDPNDVILLVSADRGANWSCTVVHHFDTLNATLDSASGGYQVLSPHCDVRLVIDNDGKIHCGGSISASLTDQGALTSGSYYPLTKGIWYWNTDMPAGIDINDPNDYDTYVLFDSVPDLTTMGSYPTATADQGVYSTGQFSHASLSTDQSGNIFIVYSGITCGSDNNPFDNRFRRDLFGLASGDGGATWSEPKNIASLLFANDITDGTVGEEAYPVTTKRSNDGNVHVLFQYDSWAGPFLNDPNPVSEENKLTYLALDATLLGISDDNEFAKESFNIYPNPASSSAVVSFESSVKGNSSVVLSNLIGQTVRTVDFEVVKGTNNVSLDLNNLNKGIYLVTIGTGKNRVTQKLVIE